MSPNNQTPISPAQFWKNNPELLPPGPTGLGASINSVRAMLFSSFALPYYKGLITKYDSPFVTIPFPLVPGGVAIVVADAQAYHRILTDPNIERSALQQGLPVGALIAGIGGDPKHQEAVDDLENMLGRTTVAALLPLLGETMDQVLDSWDQKYQKGKFDFFKELLNLSAANVGIVLAGGTDLPAELLLEAVDLIGDSLAMIGLPFFRRKQDRVLKKLADVIMLCADGVPRGVISNFYQRVEDAYDKEAELLDQAKNLLGTIGAAVETIAGHVGLTLLNLSENHVQYEMVREEALYVLDVPEIDHIVVRQLVLAVQASEMTHIVDPTIWRPLRQTNPDGDGVQLGKWYIPPGFQILPLPGIANSRTNIWGEQPQGYDLGIAEKNRLIKITQQHPEANTAFSGGDHLCRGRVFAQMMSPLQIAAITARYRQIEFPKKGVRKYGPTLTLYKGLRVRLVK